MTDRVDLDVPAKRRLNEKALHEGTVLQSFAFDEVHRHLYALQVRRGGIGAGNLCLNQLDYDGELLGHMHLQGFGHGVSMGVQNAADGTVWIWTEAEAKGGYGQAVTRFRFAPGATRTVDDVNTRKPIPGSTNNQPTVCMASKRIAVRYRRKGKPRYRVWDLDAFVHRDYDDPIADIASPTRTPTPRSPSRGTPCTATTSTNSPAPPTTPRPTRPPSSATPTSPASTSPPANCSSACAPRPAAPSPTASRRASPSATGPGRASTSASRRARPAPAGSPLYAKPLP
ncbi:hypothetical protein B1R27_19885 [Streptomyces sp. GKU 895]|nr:hypothetical protein B1R27_19885 [Streptomyces sp. GKU 895]